MLSTTRKYVTYANVMATIAVFLALGGGAIAAKALKKNSVGTKQLKANAVTEPKIAGNAVSAAKIADGAVGAAKIADGAVGAGKIADGAVNGAKVADGTIGLADVNASLHQSCPGGTAYLQGACIETSARPTDLTWDTARGDCADEGRRLPALHELDAYRLRGAALTAEEWSMNRSAFDVDDNDTPGVLVEQAATMNSAGTVALNGLGVTENYRCVAEPTG